MSVSSSSPKSWTLDSRYDDSDPTAKILITDIMQILNISVSTVYGHLPASKYARENGYILGIKMKDVDDDTYPPPPPSDEEVPRESLYAIKESARIANNKVAEYYKSLDTSNSKPQKKEHPPEWFKNAIWRKVNGTLDKLHCPVCNMNQITSDSFHAGHILPESKGGMICIENIMPICGECNSQMGTRHLYWFAWHYYGKVMWSVY